MFSMLLGKTEMGLDKAKVGSDFNRQPGFLFDLSVLASVLLAILHSYQLPRFHHIVFLINVSLSIPFPSSDCSIQLEAFYSIFTTEQQDHVKSVEYLRNNFRPQQSLNNRIVSKSAVKDAWSQVTSSIFENPLGTEASKGRVVLSTSNFIILGEVFGRRESN